MVHKKVMLSPTIRNTCICTCTRIVVVRSHIMDPNFDLYQLGELCENDNITVTQLDILPTQDLFKIESNQAVNRRFSTVDVVTEADLSRRREERVPRSTRKQNSWGMSVYEGWAVWRNTQLQTMLNDNGTVPLNLTTTSLVDLDYWFSRFIIECRRKDGKPYPPSTLYNIASSIQRTLREQYGRNDVNLYDQKDPSFAVSISASDLRSKLFCHS